MPRYEVTAPNSQVGQTLQVQLNANGFHITPAGDDDANFYVDTDPERDGQLRNTLSSLGKSGGTWKNASLVDRQAEEIALRALPADGPAQTDGEQTRPAAPSPVLRATKGLVRARALPADDSDPYQPIEILPGPPGPNGPAQEARMVLPRLQTVARMPRRRSPVPAKPNRFMGMSLAEVQARASVNNMTQLAQSLGYSNTHQLKRDLLLVYGAERVARIEFTYYCGEHGFSLKCKEEDALAQWMGHLRSLHRRKIPLASSTPVLPQNEGPERTVVPPRGSKDLSPEEVVRAIRSTWDELISEVEVLRAQEQQAKEVLRLADEKLAQAQGEQQSAGQALQEAERMTAEAKSRQDAFEAQVQGVFIGPPKDTSSESR